MVAMTAIARKIVLFDMGEASDALEMLGMAAIMVSIAVGYYLVKKSEP
jgi:uncharacterized membrane protein (DUF373 family)